MTAGSSRCAACFEICVGVLVWGADNPCFSASFVALVSCLCPAPCNCPYVSHTRKLAHQTPQPPPPPAAATSVLPNTSSPLLCICLLHAPSHRPPHTLKLTSIWVCVYVCESQACCALVGLYHIGLSWPSSHRSYLALILQKQCGREPHPYALWEITNPMQARATAAGLMLVAPYASHWRSITLQRRHHAQPATYPPHAYGIYDHSSGQRPLSEQTHTQVSCLVKKYCTLGLHGGKLAMGFSR